MLTIRNLMELKSFKEAKIIAGMNNVDNVVCSVTVLEATNDDVVLWIKENELFLTTFYSIAEDESQQLKIIEMLHNKKSAGLVICSIGYWLKYIPPKVISLAEKLGLPLIIMPSECTFYEILFETMGCLLNYQNSKLILALQIQNDMYSLLMRKKNVNELLDYLSYSLKKSVLYYDSDNKLAYENEKLHNGKKDANKILQNIRLEDIFNETKGVYIDNTIYFPLKSFGDYFGMLVVLDVKDYECESMSLVVSHAVLTIMLITDKKKRIPRHDTWKLKDFMNNLLNNKYKSGIDIYEKADDTGIDLSEKHYLLVITNNNLKNTEFYASNLEYIKCCAKNENLRNEVVLYDNQVTIFIHSGKNSDMRRRLSSLCDSIIDNNKNRSGDISIGISSYFDSITEAYNAFIQANNSIIIGRKLLNTNCSIFYDDIGFYSLLNDLSIDSNLIKNVKKRLEIIKDYDEKNNSDYFDTLSYLINNKDKSIEQIAKDLHIHKNTLIYRKKRIIEILEDDPFTMPQKLNYELYFIMILLKNNG